MEYMTEAMLNYYDAATEFMLHNKSNNLSPRTLRNYEMVTRFFGEFLKEHGYEETGPTPRAVAEWKTALSASGAKPTTIRQYLVQLRSFFTWACDEDLGNCYYQENPVSTKHNPKIRNADRPYENLLTQDEVAMLLSDSGNNGSKTWAKSYAIIVVFLTTAIRNDELLALTPADLDYEKGIIKIRHGKGDKYRTVQFPSIAQEAVKKYLASGARPKNIGDNEPLFGSSADEDGHHSEFLEWHKACNSGISRLVERHVRRVTGRKGVRSHALRHASAATMLANGMPTEEIQVILGHSDIETTQRYTGRLAEAEVNKHAVKIFDEMEFIAMRSKLREAG